MMIYNVTTNVHESIHEDWLDWMQHEHIPEMIATGKFTRARLVKVLIDEEMGGTTYSVQFYSDSKIMLEKFYDQDVQRFNQRTAERFGDKAVSFQTELQIISDHKAV